MNQWVGGTCSTATAVTSGFFRRTLAVVSVRKAAIGWRRSFSSGVE